MSYFNITTPNISMPNITIPTMMEVQNWIDGHTSIGQCVANSTEALDVLRCDPDLSSLPTKYDPSSLCYTPCSIGSVHELSWLRITRQLYSTDLIEKVTEQLIAMRNACYEQRRNCSLIFNATNETALKAFECLKPHFGNMFHFENDSSVQNLCRIAYNKFGEVRGILEIDLFTRGLSFFDKECSQLEPLFLFRSGLPFEGYMNDSDLFLIKSISLVAGGILAEATYRILERQPMPNYARTAILASSVAALASLLYSGDMKQNDFAMDQVIQKASICAISILTYRCLRQFTRGNNSSTN